MTATADDISTSQELALIATPPATVPSSIEKVSQIGGSPQAQDGVDQDADELVVESQLESEADYIDSDNPPRIKITGTTPKPRSHSRDPRTPTPPPVHTAGTNGLPQSSPEIMATQMSDGMDEELARDLHEMIDAHKSRLEWMPNAGVEIPNFGRISGQNSRRPSPGLTPRAPSTVPISPPPGNSSDLRREISHFLFQYFTYMDFSPSKLGRAYAENALFSYQLNEVDPPRHAASHNLARGPKAREWVRCGGLDYMSRAGRRNLCYPRKRKKKS
ncbi:hypothetical protein BOTBODRAFT_339945 [Botryobasidium botryosum FD-172 SS1]|uniref:NTF2 domain-containing protein n=1 Tax=Botryobasidium botryosum (strain FD-172 SS1) TaxID=930990 RepID=A0A067MJ55_BOTB1|nr:hypothetical protein BOTBODRAFT_339945 [Botryobasidium botryosum FD-172 SS1]